MERLLCPRIAHFLAILVPIYKMLEDQPEIYGMLPCSGVP